MASTFSISKYTGVSPGTETTGMNYQHLINQDIAENTTTGYRTTTANQITVPVSGNVYSYEAWFRAKWSGSYNTISAFSFYRTGPTNSSGGLDWYAGVNGTTYVQPVNTVSSVATDNTFESSGAAISVTVAGSTPNVISNFFVLQLRVASTASPGDVTDSTYHYQWTES